MCAATSRSKEELLFSHHPVEIASNGGARNHPAVTQADIAELDEPRRAGLLLLLRGHEFADDLHRSDWDFALEISALSRLGLSRIDLRWLVLKGYVTHATEVTAPAASEREFSPNGKLSFTSRTCFLLTPLGASVARALRDSRSSAPTAPATSLLNDSDPSRSESTAAMLPCWDCDRRELRLAGRIVKQFKVRSPNQETVLMAFQEEGWPSRIDDPLPGHPDMDAKQRLHDTIRSLNRNQRERLIRFKGDGRGEGVIWEPAFSPS